jgi:tight adherence protein B
MTIWLVTFVFVLILGGGTAAAYHFGQKQKQSDRLVSVITRNAGVGNDGKDKNLARQRADIARKLAEAGDEKAKKKGRTTLRELMEQAGISAPVWKFWVGSLIFAVVTWALLSLMTSWPQIAVVFATFTAFLGIPKMFLKRRAARRQTKFLAEFPDALDAAVRLLQAGMPISEAVAMVSREFTGPLRDEMSRMYDNQKVGMPLGAAALEMARRIPLTEVHMFATALQIQSETGSSLSEVLSNLSAVIRARFRLKRKVKALSSEAKASAAIIAALPILVSFGLYMVNEKYISILFDTTKGNFLLGGAVFWMCCGVLIMRQMINFKV